MANSEQKATYMLPNAEAAAETARLDDMNAGFTNYFGGRLSMAPLEDLRPSHILELGAGSGAWAIHAAEQFPSAEVLAVDLNPLPSRPLPSNLRFRMVDLTKTTPFPDFTEQHFDIVHMRLVLMHLPGAEDVLKRILPLIKPGGWLLIEDTDDTNVCDSGGPLPPAMAEFAGKWVQLLRSRGAEPSIARHIESILRESGLFSEVNARKVTVPVCGQSNDRVMNQWGAIWKQNIQQFGVDFPIRLAQHGFDQMMASKFLEELNDPVRSITVDVYLTWSRRVLNDTKIEI